MRIEIPVYDGFDEVDAIAPFEILSNVKAAHADVEVELVALTDRVRSSRVPPRGS
ncbi:MAG: hypothetical protein ABI345_13295 [Jatrophihabitans sp.]